MSLGNDVTHLIDPPVKPHYGRIETWYKSYCGPKGLGYFIIGRFLDHPRFALLNGHTSYVVKHDEYTGEIETRNSRYTLVGPELKQE